MAKTKPILPIINRSHPLAKGLVGCWSFFERGGNTLHDISRKNNNGTLINNPTWVRTPFGSGLSFTATSSQYVNVNPFPLFGTSDFTIEWWEYRITNTGCSVGRGYDAGLGAILLSFETTGSIYMTSNNSSWDIADNRTIGAPILNAWSHLVVVRNGSNFYSYRDGIQKDTWTSALSIYASTDLTFGVAQNSNHFISGIIDEVRVYNRALSESEILYSYSNPFALYKRPKIFSLGAIPEIVPPVLTNLTVTTGTSDGELNISFDYNEAVSTVPHCEIAIARIDTDLPTGSHTGTETDSLVYNVFKPIYKTATNELPAMANNASGTYSVTLKLPDNGKVYITVSACDNSNNWANWMTAVSGTIKGIGGGGGEHSYAF